MIAWDPILIEHLSPPEHPINPDTDGMEASLGAPMSPDGTWVGVGR